MYDPRVPWKIDEVASVRQDVARYAGMRPELLWREVEDCAKDAMWAVRASGFPDEVLAFEEPVRAEAARVSTRRTAVEAAREIADARLDRAHIRQWLVDMMGEGDERVQRWDEPWRATAERARAGHWCETRR